VYVLFMKQLAAEANVIAQKSKSASIEPHHIEEASKVTPEHTSEKSLNSPPSWLL